MVSPPLENVATRLYHKLSVAFNFLLRHLHMHCINVSYPHKNFLSCLAPISTHTHN